MTLLPIKAIHVVNRVRRDLGPMRTLERSIDDLGLLQPILVSPDENGEYRLLAGARRLAAVRNLGHEEIEAIVVTTLVEATDLLRAERDENTERRQFVPTELAEMAKRLRAVEEPAAAERMKAGKRPSGNVAPGSGGRARTKVAEALGVGATNLRKIEDVVKASADESLPDEVRKAATEAAAEMDATGNVDRAHKKVRKAKAEHDPFNKGLAKLAEQVDASAVGYRLAVSKAMVKAGDLLLLDPERSVAVQLIEDRDFFVSNVRRIREWTDAVIAVLDRPTLKAVK